MKKTLSHIASCLLLVQCLLMLASPAKAAVENKNSRIEGTALLAYPALHVTDDKFVRVSGWNTGMLNVEAKDKIEFGINESKKLFHSQYFKSTITFTYTYIDELLVSHVSSTETLTVDYDPVTGTVYKDKAVLNFTGGYKVTVSISSIVTRDASNNIISNPADLYLEADIATTRYYSFSQSFIPSASDLTINAPSSLTDEQLEVAWPVITGAEEYELEWTYIDNYNGTGGTVPDAQIVYSFKNNATRVITSNNYYRLPLVYEQGKLLFRVRGIGRSWVDVTKKLEGRWSSEDPVILSSLLTAYPSQSIYIVSPHLGDHMNWTRVATFAEEGKQGNGVTYADGTLRGRQSVAMLNTEKKTIASTVLFDHAGRPAVQTLPSPLNHPDLTYNTDMDMHGANDPYDKSHFDVDNGSCSSSEPAMDDVYSNGAAKYYSPSNTDQEGMQGYIPDAEGYPFVHIEYTPDMTGRIRRVSTPGATHTLNSGKETQYFYAQPAQQELDRLFGNEVGYCFHYKKNAVVDANGQVSVTYIDMAGNVIATGLAGDAPSNLTALTGTTTGSIADDLLASNIADNDDHSLTVNRTIFVSTPNTPYTFEYEMTAESYTDNCLPNICFDCIYELEISIRNQCNGEEMIDMDGTGPNAPAPVSVIVGSLSFDNTCDNPAITYSLPTSPLTITFPQVGTYYITKTLKVSDAPISYYLQEYLDNNTCIMSLEDFQQDALADIDFSGCGYTCAQCSTALDAYVDRTDPQSLNYDASLPVLTQAEYDQLLAECNELCAPPDECAALRSSMLHDFYPGQQYATYTITNGTYGCSDHASIFYTGSSPVFNVTWQTFNWSAAGISITLPNGNPGDPGDLTMQEFITLFQPSWADALVSLHPEYCYYSFCQANSSSNSYDAGMQNTDTWTAACSAGYLEPTSALATLSATYFTGCTSSPDPYFNTGGQGASQLTAFNASVDPYDNTGLDIYELAVYTVNGSVSHAFGSDACTRDAEWLAFRALYLSKKASFVEQKRLDYVMQNGCYNGCIGNSAWNGTQDNFYCYSLTITPACPLNSSNYAGVNDSNQPCSNATDLYLTGKQKRYYSPTYALGFNPFTGSPSTSQSSFNVQNCQPTCEGYADQWMAQLAGCGLSTQDAADIRDALIDVCMAGCDGNNPFGASTCTTAVAPGSFLSFQDVLDYYLHSAGNTVDCNGNLLTFPGPFDHSYSSGNNTYAELDTCGCDKILTNSYNFDQMQTNNSLPAGVTTAAQLFTLEYGITLSDYAGLECKCNNAFGTPAWTTSSAWSSASATALNNLNVAVPEGMQCERCLPCETVTAAYNTFMSSHSGWDESSNFSTMITNYLNATLNMNMGYLQYVDFMNSCEDFANEQEICLTQITAAAQDMVTFLNEVISDGTFLTNFTMTPSNTPSFFTQSLYAYPVTSSTQVSYSYSISGSNLTITLADNSVYPAFSCTINLTVASGYTFSDVTSMTAIYADPGTFAQGWTYNFVLQAQAQTSGTPPTIIDMPGSSCHHVVECTEDAPMLCNQPLAPAAEEYNDCAQGLINQAMTNAQAAYDSYIESISYEFISDYKSKCFAVQHEEFTMDYDLHEYNYTLYYYDRAGNLTKTVPPEGVTILNNTQVAQAMQARLGLASRVYNHDDASTDYLTQYEYNSFDETVTSETVDEDGASIYFYDNVGRIVASQNAKQDAATGNVYSYTVYDAMNRITEVGEIASSSALTATDAADAILFASFVSAGTKTQVTRTIYDETISSTIDGLFTGGQANLRNRVASMIFQSTWNASNITYDHATHYSYDEHGNARYIVQDNTLLANLGQQYKMIEYKYDLVSGNVLEVAYQEAEPDQFYHRYYYDADNRLHEVYTSRDGEIWEKDAKYFFQQQGALGRVELGEKQVQGLDFAYTIQGWVKGMNSNILSKTNDIGKDGATGTSYISTLTDVHANFAEDVAGFSLSYFNNDYKSIKTITASDYFIASTANLTGSSAGFDLSSDAPDLFNGNISSMVTSITDPTTRTKLPQITAYQYDQLQRIKQMKAYSSITGNTWNTVTGSTYTDSYYMDFTYDKNGNLTDMTRKGLSTTALAMDVLHYEYYDQSNSNAKNTNRLSHVTDAVTGSTYNDDLETQSALNYLYDELGQLERNTSECIGAIEWTPYHKMKSVTRTNACQVNGTYPSDLEFAYNALQQRVMKLVKPRDQSTGNLKPESDWLYTFYTYDASGNIMAIYEKKYVNKLGNVWDEKLTVKAHEIFGSSHVGTHANSTPYQVAQVQFTASIVNGFFFGASFGSPVPTNVDNTHLARTLGYRQYELGNHLGNVLATVSDRKIQEYGTDINTNGSVDFYSADIVSSQDYYAFGQLMPGRNFSSNKYRYGLNGMEKDDEYGNGTGNDYFTEFRQYDPRLGRWTSIDPIFKEWESPYAAFANNPVVFADPSGLDPEGGGDRAEPAQGGAAKSTGNGSSYSYSKGLDMQYRMLNNDAQYAMDRLKAGSKPIYIEPIQAELIDPSASGVTQEEMTRWVYDNFHPESIERAKVLGYIDGGIGFLEFIGGLVTGDSWEDMYYDMGHGLTTEEGLRRLAEKKAFVESIPNMTPAQYNRLGANVAATIAISAVGGEEALVRLVGRAVPKLPPLCFTKGTIILTEEGEKEIQDIRVGDKVWAFNEFTGEVQLREVYHTVVKHSDKLVMLVIGGDTINTTPDHPFWIKDHWLKASQLKTGDMVTVFTQPGITAANGSEDLLDEVKQLPIKSITFKDTSVTVYNFAVREFSTYYVSKLGVLVHNNNPCVALISTQWGWSGTKVWKNLVSTVRKGGTIESMLGRVPTKIEAIKLIQESGGTIQRIEGPHLAPNPHSYPHINYTTPSGVKGTIKIQEL
jgi:RHS repeat-associated protein